MKSQLSNMGMGFWKLNTSDQGMNRVGSLERVVCGSECREGITTGVESKCKM